MVVIETSEKKCCGSLRKSSISISKKKVEIGAADGVIKGPQDRAAFFLLHYAFSLCIFELKNASLDIALDKSLRSIKSTCRRSLFK